MVKNLIVVRSIFGEDFTRGIMLLDGEFFCHTLEDAVRKVKIPGKTAIPAGTYGMIVNMSSRFKRMMPLLINVPQFDGVRIHGGNTAADTEGCILVAKNVVGLDRIQGTMESALMERLAGGTKFTIKIVEV